MSIVVNAAELDWIMFGRADVASISDWEGEQEGAGISCEWFVSFEWCMIDRCTFDALDVEPDARQSIAR